MSTMKIVKTKGQSLSANGSTFTIGAGTIGADNKRIVFQRFERENVLYIPAFDGQRTFEGWAEIEPAPKTVSDIESLGFKVFDAALSNVVVQVQASIRRKTSGKELIQRAMLGLMADFMAGRITEAEMRAKVDALDNPVVQL